MLVFYFNHAYLLSMITLNEKNNVPATYFHPNGGPLKGSETS